MSIFKRKANKDIENTVEDAVIDVEDANTSVEDSAKEDTVHEQFMNDLSDKALGIAKDLDEIEDKQEYIDAAIEVVITYFTSTAPTILNSYDRGKIELDDVKRYVVDYIKKEAYNKKFGKPDEETIEAIYDGFAKFIWGYDIIEPLINDLDISDINITRYDKVNIKVKGERKPSGIKFRSDDSYRRFVEHVAIKNRKSISDIDALRWFVDGKSSDKFRLRFNISTDVVSVPGYPYISVRKIPKFKYGFDRLIQDGMMTREQADYLIDRVKNGHSGIICGRGGSGKTILMNELLEFFRKDMRFDIIQDNEELFCDTHDDMIFHKTVEPQGEAKVSYGLDILGRNGLLEDLDGFVVGEIKGTEAAWLGHFAYTDHMVWCTEHAESIYDAHYKIADYAKPITGERPEDYIRKIKSIDTIIFMRKYKIVQIGECKGLNSDGTLNIVPLEF